MKTRMYRQGDVLLIATNAIPSGAKPVPRQGERIVLAAGEATGHAHAICDESASLWTLRELDDEMERYLHAESAVTITHEEHGPITIPAGDWIVRRQREYSPTELRRVSD